jgi:hypothetical protein
MQREFVIGLVVFVILLAIVLWVQLGPPAVDVPPID